MSEEIKVIGAGFGRTGTTSLKSALDVLGFKAYNMLACSGKHDKEVVAAFQGGEKEFGMWMDTLLKEGYSATTDFPACLFYKEQMKMFPKAKVILTLRDPEAWFKSYEGLMLRAATFRARPQRWFSSRLKFHRNSIGCDQGTHGRPKLIPKDEEFEWYNPWYFPWIKIPIAAHLDKDACIKYYNDHLEEVRRTVPKERLLEIHVCEGWKPICDFLNLPIPDVPFPNVNSFEQNTKITRKSHIISTLYPFIFISGVAAFGGIGFGVSKLLKK